MTDIHTEETITSERIYSGRVVTLDVDQVRLPEGGRSLREVVRHPGAAVILPVLDDGRLVLIRQYRYAAGEVLLELPAGTLEPGEDPKTCASRELIEETGWRAASLEGIGRIFTTPGFSDEVIHIFVATRLQEHADGSAPDADEDIETVLIPAEEVFDLARRGGVEDSKTLAALLLGRLHGFL